MEHRLTVKYSYTVASLDLLSSGETYSCEVDWSVLRYEMPFLNPTATCHRIRLAQSTVVHYL